MGTGTVKLNSGFVLSSDQSLFVLRYAERQFVWRLENEIYNDELLQALSRIQKSMLADKEDISGWGVGNLYGIDSYRPSTNSDAPYDIKCK